MNDKERVEMYKKSQKNLLKEIERLKNIIEKLEKENNLLKQLVGNDKQYTTGIR